MKFLIFFFEKMSDSIPLSLTVQAEPDKETGTTDITTENQGNNELTAHGPMEQHKAPLPSAAGEENEEQQDVGTSDGHLSSKETKDLKESDEGMIERIGSQSDDTPMHPPEAVTNDNRLTVTALPESPTLDGPQEAEELQENTVSIPSQSMASQGQHDVSLDNTQLMDRPHNLRTRKLKSNTSASGSGDILTIPSSPLPQSHLNTESSCSPPITERTSKRKRKLPDSVQSRPSLNDVNLDKKSRKKKSVKSGSTLPSINNTSTEEAGPSTLIRTPSTGGRPQEVSPQSVIDLTLERDSPAHTSSTSLERATSIDLTDTRDGITVDDDDEIQITSVVPPPPSQQQRSSATLSARESIPGAILGHLENMLRVFTSPAPTRTPPIQTASTTFTSAPTDISSPSTRSTRKSKKQTLPILPPTNTAPEEPEVPSNVNLRCGICLSPFSSASLSSTICGHIFCHECITQALKVNKKCPVCRKDLKGRNAVHRLFVS